MSQINAVFLLSIYLQNPEIMHHCFLFTEIISSTTVFSSDINNKSTKLSKCLFTVILNNYMQPESKNHTDPKCLNSSVDCKYNKNCEF